MRKMKDSGIAWVGKIPQEWKTTKVKYCFSSVKEIVDAKFMELEKGVSERIKGLFGGKN